MSAMLQLMIKNNTEEMKSGSDQEMVSGTYLYEIYGKFQNVQKVLLRLGLLSTTVYGKKYASSKFDTF